MADMIGDAELYLNSVLSEHCSVKAVYSVANSSESFEISAIVGKTLFRTSAMSGLAAYVSSVDFIVDVSEMPCQPDSGDRILHNGRLFEVFSLDGEPCWRYSGDTMTKYRIHTHEIFNHEQNI